ncbi:MAG: carbon-nitrogen hydrolase family protein [Sedimentisphaerales bacterium]|nr:carbon-nitrogen hydrolase family protein [Sedimentisphaerales bacterium]
MKKVQVAMCQIFSLDGDREGNFIRIENAVEQAKEAGAEIICFPETVILGWVNSDAHQRAYSIPGKDSKRLCKLAEDYESYICVGLAEKEANNLYDSAVLINDTGQILLKHRKINLLSELMSPPYTPGGTVDVVDTKFGRIGLLICADTHSDDILNKMTELKPDLLLVPYGYAAPDNQWPEHGKELEEVVKTTAVKTGTPVVGTNLVGEITKGPWQGRIYGGYSIAVDETGGTISVAKDRDRDINIVQITIG